MQIEVYTDGSATVSTKPGGWAYVLVIDGKKHAECAGHMVGASNNDAEMEAAIQGLIGALKYVNWRRQLLASSMADEPQIDRLTRYEVTLCSDSQLVLGWASGTYQFRQQSKIEKYDKLTSLMRRMGAKTKWIKGHDGNEHNERCDTLANEARTGVTRQKEKAEAIVNGNTLIGIKKTGTLCVWYKNCLKIIDLETNVIEDYDRATHGPRGGVLEIREEKSR
jgi:ribonuclease HI